MYTQDTFFHLSPYGRIGLVVLSLILSAAMIFVFWKTTKPFKLPIKLIFAVFFIWTFIWLSPQAYYLYYIQIIEGLPLQVIIQTPPGIVELIQTITFTGDSNLSNHSKGLLFWVMVTLSLEQHKNNII